MRFGSCFCINIIKGGFPVNMDLGNSVYLFLSIQRVWTGNFLFQLFFFKHKGCVLFLSIKNTSQSGDNYGFVFLSGEHRPTLRTCQSSARLRAAQTGCDLAWRWQSRTEPGAQALYQQLVSPGAGRPGRSSRGWGPCGLEAAEREPARRVGAEPRFEAGRHPPPFFVLI